MTIVPAFELTQNEKFLIVSIQAPYAKVSDVQVEYEDYEFMFFSKPYFLRLYLPSKVSGTEEPEVQYDFDKRIFIINVLKAQEGEKFENLDLITKLLAPRKKKASVSPLIEVIEGSEAEESEEEFDWTIEQVPSKDEFGVLNITGQQCGFGNRYSFSVFNLKEEVDEIFDVKEPQNKSPKVRREERLKVEREDFSEDHYLADLYEIEGVKQVLNYQPECDVLLEELSKEPSQNIDHKVTFSPEEKERLMKLPNKEYLLDKTEKTKAFYGLIDVLFAYAYNKRTTEGENTVVSAWTINKLSATLSWLETYDSLDDVACVCIRRSLCYPLYRHFLLSMAVLDDVRRILLTGRKYVIKCLLEIHQLFCSSEPRYILNDLFISDFCVWMQSKKCTYDKLKSLATKLGELMLSKKDVGLDLIETETAASLWESMPDCGGITRQLGGLKINDSTDSDSS